MGCQSHPEMFLDRHGGNPIGFCVITRAPYVLIPSKDSWPVRATVRRLGGKTDEFFFRKSQVHRVSGPVRDGLPALGTWQQIVLLECDIRPRQREIVVTVQGV